MFWYVVLQFIFTSCAVSQLGEQQTKLAHSALSSLYTLHSIEVFMWFLCFILQQSKNFDTLKLVYFLANIETVISYPWRLFYPFLTCKCFKISILHADRILAHLLLLRKGKSFVATNSVLNNLQSCHLSAFLSVVTTSRSCHRRLWWRTGTMSVFTDWLL